MLQSLGLAELSVIGLVILILFGGKWLAGASGVAGHGARKKVLAAKVFWTSIIGTAEERLCAERALGQELAQEISQRYNHSVAEAKQASLDRLGTRLCEANTSWPFSYRVIPDPAMNAFALPGGFVFVSEGLFDRFHDDSDAIAFVLAHEMAHTLLGHHRERWMLQVLVLGVTAKFRTTGIGRLVKRLIVHDYSRDDELEADKRAVSLVSAAGFDRSGATRVLETFGRIAHDEPPFMEYFSSHPSVEERQKNLTPVCDRGFDEDHRRRVSQPAAEDAGRAGHAAVE